MSSHRQATALVLMRRRADTAGVEVYLTRRSERLAFLGGFHAFAGGSVDPADAQVPVSGLADSSDAPWISAAVRELFEETGVLAVPGAEHTAMVECAVLRRRVLEDGSSWPEVLARLGLVIDARLLMPMGRWITPPFSPMRFDARYFGVWLPAGQEPEIWPGELSDGAWVEPARALEAHEDGALHLSYPVIETLEVMIRHGDDVEAAARELEGRGAEAYPHAGGEIFTGVHVVPLRSPTLPPATHTNTYVLGRRELIVVDPATPYPEEQERLLGYLRHLESKGGTVREIWLTHHHEDHIGAVERLRAVYGVPVAAHALTAEDLRGTLRVDRLISDGELTRLDLANGRHAEWTALHTPGHARGHLCFYERTRASLLTGDLVASVGTIIVGPPDGDMRDYLASLRRLLELPHGFMFPAHGPPIAATRAKLQEYIDHRLAREAAVLAALDQPLTPEQLVPRVYTDVPPAVYPLARINVVAHLDKLVAEGRVRREGVAYVRN